MSEAETIDEVGIILNEDQKSAEEAIFAAYNRGESEFLLIGAAGTGKTTLMQSVCRRFFTIKIRNKNTIPVLTSPTHKATAVLRKKMDEAGLNHIHSMTIHSLMCLKPTVNDSEKHVLERNYKSPAKLNGYGIVVIDEASMISSDLQKFINSDLRSHFVLYVADEAQLPPVGEEIAQCFKKVPGRNTFRLTKIVRQAEGNPILVAASVLRLQQGTGQLDWSWTMPAINKEAKQGIYHCGKNTDRWLEQAFTSNEFKADNDSYRYIAYTNARVKQINSKIRKWIYGNTATPFIGGERVMCRNTILNDDELPVFNTNEEAIINSIEEDDMKFSFGAMTSAGGQRALPAWKVELPVWKIRLRKPDRSSGSGCYAYMVKDEFKYRKIENKLLGEAKANRNRWRAFYSMKNSIADLRSVYALTSHSSQGSTFGVAFLDVPDLSSRARDNILECQKLMYVAVTRASKAIVLVGV